MGQVKQNNLLDLKQNIFFSLFLYRSFIIIIKSNVTTMLILINNIMVGCFVSVNFVDKLSSQRNNSQVSFQNPKPTTFSKFLSKPCLQISFIEKNK